jgi:hypothetical protein
MIRKIGALAGAALVFFFASHAHAVDAVAVSGGHGDDSTSLLRFALVDTWRKGDPFFREWRLAGYWEFSAGVWDNKDDSTADIGITPVFRIERRGLYVEGAIGVHLVQTHISASRTFSTALQFGDHLGAGMHFGPAGRYDIGLRVQHLSNGGVRSPNPGINFLIVRLQCALE